jgi:hypothetical protein
VSPTCRRERQEGEAKGLYRIFVQASSLFTSPPLMVIFSRLSYRPVTLFSLRSTLLSAILSVAMAYPLRPAEPALSTPIRADVMC